MMRNKGKNLTPGVKREGIQWVIPGGQKQQEQMPQIMKEFLGEGEAVYKWRCQHQARLRLREPK